MESNELLQIQPISEMPIARYPNMNSSQNTPSASLISLGCSKNTVDSEIMLASLSSYGFKLEPEFNKAEIVIINTCGFIDNGCASDLNGDGLWNVVDIVALANCVLAVSYTHLTLPTKA